MFKNKKQIVIFSVMLGLLVLTGYLNFRFNNNNATSVSGTNKAGGVSSSQVPQKDQETMASSANFFVQFKSDKEQVRAKEMENINSIIDNKSTDAETLKVAQTQKLALTTSMEKEIVVEGLLKSKGFEQAAVTIRQGSVNVIIDMPTVSEPQAAQILDIVMRETGEKAENIKILPKN